MTEPPEDWPDEVDITVLATLGDVYDRLDPPPPDLDERVLFALAVQQLGAEVARVQADQLIGSGARAAERARRISFDADNVSIMVTVTERPDGDLRLDGWLASPGAARVELRLPASVRTPVLATTADQAGRFVFPSVPHGPMWLVVVTATETVVTPSLTL